MKIKSVEIECRDGHLTKLTRGLKNYLEAFEPSKTHSGLIGRVIRSRFDLEIFSHQVADRIGYPRDWTQVMAIITLHLLDEEPKE